MTPLPPPLGSGEFVAWRLDLAGYKEAWDSGTGAARAGGRWNSIGVHAVYCSLDPATAILEVAVHTGFDALDRVPRVMTSCAILAPETVHVVQPGDVPNPHWLNPGYPGANQQRFGDARLAAQPMFVIPSTVSAYSWNLIFLAGTCQGRYRLRNQERFALDPRLAA